MQYYRHDESKGQTSDRQARAAAHARMRQRRNRKLIWWAVILVVIAALYFTVGRSHVQPWLTGQARYVSEDVTGAAKNTEDIFSRRGVLEEEEQIKEESVGSGASLGDRVGPGD